MSATVAALTRSAATLVRLKPRRSTMGPPKNAARTAPSAPTAPVSPVLAALSVVCRTNQGIATAAMALPTTETALAKSSARIGARRSGRASLEHPVSGRAAAMRLASLSGLPKPLLEVRGRLERALGTLPGETVRRRQTQARGTQDNLPGPVDSQLLFDGLLP